MIIIITIIIILSLLLDAFFQGNFFNELGSYIGQRSSKEYLLMSLEGPEGGKSLQACPYHYETSEDKCFHGILQDKQKFMENNIICGGSITGSHMGIVRILDVFLEYMGYLDPSCLVDPFIGQIVLQMIIYQYFALHPEELDLFIPDNFYSPTFTMGYVDSSSFHIDGNFAIQIFPKNLSGASRIPSYVHQYDRHPILENLVKQKLMSLDQKDLSILPISIVMVSYRSTEILIHTLKSYINSKLLDHVFECIIYLQEISDDDIVSIEKLSPKFKILGSSANLQLAHAIDILFNAATMPFVMLLEKDWEITVSEGDALAELRKAVKALSLEAIDVYQLRSVQNPGFPLFLKLRYENLEDELYTTDVGHLCGSRFWVHDYKERWPEHFRYCGDENITCTSSWSCDYNNNPYLVSQVFYQRHLSPEIKKIKQQVAIGMAMPENLQVESWFVENLNAWRMKNFTVGFGNGIFTHNDFLKYEKYVIKDREILLSLEYARRETELKNKHKLNRQQMIPPYNYGSPDHRTVFVCPHCKSSFSVPGPLECQTVIEGITSIYKVYPISIAIPEKEIYPFPLSKDILFSQIDPRNTSTYIYDMKDELQYKTNMAHSLYSYTLRKGGWDTLRHYEILMSLTIPYFADIESAPNTVMPFLPREMIVKGMELIDSITLTRDTFGMPQTIAFDNFSLDKYFELLCCLRLHTEKYLTTKALAKYILKKSNNKNAKRVLLLLGDTTIYEPFDFVAYSIIHGMKELLGDRATDYPKDSLLYEYSPINEGLDRYELIKKRSIHGMGYTLTRKLRDSPHINRSTEEILRNIKEKAYDVVVYLQFQRGTPFLDDVLHFYDTESIILVDGEDVALSNLFAIEKYHLKNNNTEGEYRYPPYNSRWIDLVKSNATFFKREIDECPIV